MEALAAEFLFPSKSMRGAGAFAVSPRSIWNSGRVRRLIEIYELFGGRGYPFGGVMRGITRRVPSEACDFSLRLLSGCQFTPSSSVALVLF